MQDLSGITPGDAPANGHSLDAPSPANRADSLSRLELPAHVISALPAEFIKRHRVLPIKIDGGSIVIATAEMADQRIVDDIRLLTGREVTQFHVEAPELLEKIAQCLQVTVEQMIENLDPKHGGSVEEKNLHDIEVMANEPTVVNLVNVIISTALRERASDIHLVPFEDKLQLRYRIDGLLQEKPPPPRNLHAALVSRVKIMADMNIAERFLPQDGHIQIHHRGSRVDIRVGTMPTIYGESMVLRLLEKNSRPLTPQELGLDDERSRLLHSLVQKPHGLFLATGPTGSGKTTTLYSILQGIYTPDKKILTIEDPVEYELAGVAQIPVRPTRNFTFASGLRSILRQDPDVVMVGEIRDSETAEIAIRAALTGHQVFSTLHTNDSVGAVTRLLDMGIEAFLISSSLEGVLAQRLVRKICTHCRVETEVAPATREKIEAMSGDVTRGPYYKGRGCEECREIGYRGRVGIFELLAIGAEMQELILHKRSNAELKSLARKSMITMHQDALNKAAAGLTTLEEIIRVSSGDSWE